MLRNFWLIIAALCAVQLCAAADLPFNVKWEYPLEHGAGAPTLFPSVEAPTGVVLGEARQVTRLSANGELLMTYPLDTFIASPVTVADLTGNGTHELVFLLGGGSIHCIDERGAFQWAREYGVETGGFKHVAAADVHPSPGLEVIFGFDDGWLRCLSATGAPLWEFYGDAYRVGIPAVGDANGDGTPNIVYGTDNGNIYCLDGWGEVVWRFTELAPFGRSGVNLARLRGDGAAEVLVTRSNVNNNTCLIALDGRNGSLLWRTRDVMQGYVSNAVADLDGGGVYSVIHADKGNNLYAENADGTRRWHVELDGRGIFWAPAMADLTGDGRLETITGVRGRSHSREACAYIVDVDGALLAELDLGGDGNTAPAVGDIDGDGRLEVLFVAHQPGRLLCLGFPSEGRVGWPSVRGDSAMTGRAPNVPPGTPRGIRVSSALTPVIRSFGEVAGTLAGVAGWGEMTTRLNWEKPAPAHAFIEAVTAQRNGFRRTRIQELRPGATEVSAKWDLTWADAATVALRYWEPSNPEAGFCWSWISHGAPEPDGVPWEPYAHRYETARRAGADIGADTRGLTLKWTRLQALSEDLEQMPRTTEAQRQEVARAATELRTEARKFGVFTSFVDGHWSEERADAFVAWLDENPWDAFDPAIAPVGEPLDGPVRFTAFVNEYENAALNVMNITGESIDVRAVFRAPDFGQQWYQPEPELARRITLRRAVGVPASNGQLVFDALPELDRSRALTIPPGEARQLWLELNTHGLAPGSYSVTLYLGSLTQTPLVREIPIEIEVWPISLPSHMYAAMNWNRLDFETVSEQTIADMVEHGIRVSYGPPLPPVPVDAEGNLAGQPDWTQPDAYMDRAPRPWTFLFSGVRPAWPEGAQPPQDAPEYFNGFRTALRELTLHLQARGLDYHHWALMTGDEPWNNGFEGIPEMRAYCEMVKRADPDVQIYANPAGLVRVEYVAEFKDLIDIWQPEVNLLKRDPALAEWFRANAKRFWFYEASSPAKNFLPLGYYRVYPWYAWHFGAEGGGRFVYKALDIWWPLPGGDWSFVYQTDREVVPSRRWQAERDGIEDYRAFRVLEAEAERVRALGHAEAADAALKLLLNAFDEVVGWQIGLIDEITRQTRDYEVDFSRILQYRRQIAKTILALRQITQ